MTNRPALTAEQQAALSTRDVSVALDAGAGCGKTFVLTERFLSHLELGSDGQPAASLHQLIAITFTDAAAREMRRRIRQACLARLQAAAPEESGYWLGLLRSIDAVRVSTIHSFCGSLVRSHAVELGVDPLFRVLDNASALVMRSEAIDAALRGQLESRDQRVMHLAKEFDLTGLKHRVATMLDAAAEPSFADWLGRSPEEVARVNLEAYRDEYLPALRRRIGESDAARETLRLLTLATPEGGFSDTRDRLTAALSAFAVDEPGEQGLLELRPLTMLRGVTKAGDWPDAATFEDYKQAIKKLRTLIDGVKPPPTQEQAREAAELGLDLLAVTTRADQAYREAKQSVDALDYDDLLSQARRLLTSPEFADAQQRLQTDIRLLMVDEFQDTDRQQVEIVKALVGAGFDEGRLFFVGDFKQSIYRFRGAEPKVFRQLQNAIPPAGRLPLATNFRSQPAVLDFVNTLFAPVFGEAYTPLRAARPQTNESPAAEFMWTPIAETASASACRQAEARSIARRLRQMIDDEAPLVAERDEQGGWSPRPVRAGDVAILFRALGDVQHYEQALRDEQIAYHLVGGHAFYAQQEVFDVANLLRAIASGCDEVALVGVLRSPFFSLHDETLLSVARLSRRVTDSRTSPGAMAAGFASRETPPDLDSQEAAKLHTARATLQALRQRKGRTPVADMLVDAIRRTSYDAILLSEFLGQRKLANLSKLIEQARAFDAYRPGDLDGFVRQLTEFVAREPKEALAATRSGPAEDVRLMTVHGAKGLEFPVVVLADLDRKTRGDADQVAFSPSLGPLVRPDRVEGKPAFGLDIHRAAEAAQDQEERDRLFYVACTRAADYLILSASHAVGSAPVGPWMQTIARTFDLATGEVKGQSNALPATRLVRVEPPGKDTPPSRFDGKGVDRTRLLEEAIALPSPPAIPKEARPIALDTSAIQRFSVSRLTGRLHHATSRPAAKAVDAMLTAGLDEIDARGFGTLVHAVLERMAFDGQDPLRTWTEALAPLHLNRHAEQAAREAEQLLRRFEASPRFAKLRQARRLQREVEFLLPWPDNSQQHNGAYLQGYIDCLTQDAAGEGAVLDYKTNRVDAAAVPEAAEAYRLQLYVYAMAVEQATGRPPAELCVHFLRPGVEARFEWNDAAREDARRMVDAAMDAVRAEAAQQYAAEAAIANP